jgi:3-dehydroquinate synthase
MVAAAGIGTKLGITPQSAQGEIQGLLAQFSLPTAISATPEDYSLGVSSDKKGQGSDISFVALTEIGRAKTVKLPKQQLLALL